MDIVFEEGGVGELRAAIVHHLVQNLVDEAKLFLDIVFCDLAIEVGLADENELI